MHDGTPDDRPLGTRPDEGLVRGDPVAGERGDVRDRLDEVGFAITVRSNQDTGARLEVDLDVRIGTEVHQLQPPHVHVYSTLTTGPGLPGSTSSNLTACPPNCLRSAATAFNAGESSSRDAKRAYSAAVMTLSGTPSRIASSTVHRPSPVSSTYACSPSRPGSSARASASRSSSHDRTTVPERHDRKTPGTSVTSLDSRSTAYPSA